MYARVAVFESDPTDVDDAIERVRSDVESDDTPSGLEGAKMLMLVNRETGKGLGVTLFESEEAMRRGDEALNAMNPGVPSAARRWSSTRYPFRRWAEDARTSRVLTGGHGPPVVVRHPAERTARGARRSTMPIGTINLI